MGEKHFSSPKLPHQHCGLSRPLFGGYGGLFPGDKAAGAWNWPLTTI